MLHVNKMRRRKDIINDPRAAIAASYQSGKDYKAISKNIWSPSLYNENDYSNMLNIQDGCQSSQELTSEHVYP